MKPPYQPKTGAPCTCKPGVHRDNCPHCEGTGWQIDFAAIRARSKCSVPDCAERAITTALISVNNQPKATLRVCQIHLDAANEDTQPVNPNASAVPAYPKGRYSGTTHNPS